MKSISTAFILFLISQFFAVADVSQQVPDLSKAFPSEKLIGKMFINEIEYFNFNTDLETAKLKSMLITFLGNDWIESPPKEPKNDLEKKIRMMYEGRATFTAIKLGKSLQKSLFYHSNTLALYNVNTSLQLRNASQSKQNQLQ